PRYMVVFDLAQQGRVKCPKFWVTSGDIVPSGTASYPRSGPKISADAARIAYTSIEAPPGLRVYDRIARKDIWKGERRDSWPLITPDGKTLIYSSAQGVVRRDLDAGAVTPLPGLEPGATPAVARHMSPDGRFVLISRKHKEGESVYGWDELFVLDAQSGALSPLEG